MRLSKQNAIVSYGNQERLINRNCQKQLMFLQGVDAPLVLSKSSYSSQGVDTGFPIGGGRQVLGGAPNYNLAGFSQKLHEN